MSNKRTNMPEQIDLIAKSDTNVQIEFQPELGFKDKFKLYVHVDGVTILRICKLTNEQVDLHVDALL